MKKINSTTKEYQDRLKLFKYDLHKLTHNQLNELCCADIIANLETTKLFVLKEFINDEAV